MQYAHIILPLKLDWTPIYKGPDAMCRGDWVKVVFAHREYLAVIDSISDTPNISEEKIEEIISLETGLRRVSDSELELWHFASEYYLCSIGEVFKAAYPSPRIKALKSSLAIKQKQYDKCQSEVKKIETAIEQCKCKIESKSIERNQCKEASKKADKLTSDIEKQSSKLIELQEKLKASKEQVARLSTSFNSSLLASSINYHSSESTKPELLISRDRSEYYQRVIKETLSRGAQVLLLVPGISDCISLGSTLSNISKPIFIINSSSTDSQRRVVEEYAQSGQSALFIGTRLAIWLPYSNLAQIIVEKEHDILYKQTEPSPRYNARDLAVVLAAIHKAKISLASAEPSLESRYNLLCGKYISSEHKSLGQANSSIELVDISQERRKNGMRGAFSCILLDRINHTASGKIALIKAWEKADILEEEIHKYIKSVADIEVYNYNEFRQKSSGEYALIAVLQADALVSSEDFRADERAMQLVAELLEASPRVLIQSNVAQRFTSSRDYSELLRERQLFHFPPFSRHIDILLKDPRQGEKHAKELCRLLGAVILSTNNEITRLRLSLERSADLKAKKEEVLSILKTYELQNKYYGHIVIDVDPQ